MAGKYALLVSLSLLMTGANAQLQVVNGTIKITTVTTAACSDTVNFITQQLADAYAEYKEFLEVEFIPWGRTIRNADGSLTCQFGVDDCWANRLHRCVLDKLKDNQQAKVDYMTCECTPPYPALFQRSYSCAAAAGVNIVDMDVCVATAIGEPLDAASEAAAALPMQIINFVPSIVFNDDIDVALHAESRRRLKSMICFALAEVPGTGVTNCQI